MEAAIHLLRHGSGPPSEPTEVLVAYDDKNLYVAGRLYDREPDKIQGNSMERLVYDEAAVGDFSTALSKSSSVAGRTVMLEFSYTFWG